MLNLEDTLASLYYYNIQKDLYIKGILYIIGAIVFLDLLRSQISEINLLQLVPGYYFLLVFISFILLMITSNYSFRIPFKLDKKSRIGIKTSTRISYQTRFHLSFTLVFGLLLVSLNTILPIGLDTFSSYDDETLTNLWSFDEVISLESTLVTILISLSQVPIIVNSYLSTEKQINKLPEYWKNLIFLIVIIAGFITPTIDGYTQLNLSFFAISLYLFIIAIIEKRIYIKFNSTYCLHF